MRTAPLLPICLLGAVLVGGCAGNPSPPPSGMLPASLRIDRLAPATIVSPREAARIGRQIPAEYRGSVLAAEALGVIVYAHAHMATLAAGMIAAGGHPTLSGTPAGWFAERVDGRLAVVFIVHFGNGLAVAAEVLAPGNSGTMHLQRWQRPRSLTPQELVLWRARQLAFSARITPCAKRYDPVIVPIHAKGTDQIYVYLLPAASDPDQILLGGYYRVTLSADGNRVLGTHAFTHACIALHRHPSSAAASVTELESETPTAPQIYASLRYGLPVYVATADNRLVWKVEHGIVSLVGSVDTAQ